jgi:hypothetical protein
VSSYKWYLSFGVSEYNSPCNFIFRTRVTCPTASFSLIWRGSKQDSLPGINFQCFHIIPAQWITSVCIQNLTFIIQSSLCYENTEHTWQRVNLYVDKQMRLHRNVKPIARCSISADNGATAYTSLYLPWFSYWQEPSAKLPVWFCTIPWLAQTDFKANVIPAVNCSNNPDVTCIRIYLLLHHLIIRNRRQFLLATLTSHGLYGNVDPI